MPIAELDLLDIDPFDLLADEEPFEPVAASAPVLDRLAATEELLERALRVIAEFEKAPKRRRPTKARVKAHLPGQHNQQSHGNSVSSPNALKGLHVVGPAEYRDHYGDVIDDGGVHLGADGEEPPTLLARYFDSGDMHVSLHLEDGSVQVLEEMSPDAMRQLAYNLEDVLAVDETQFEGGDPYGIVADADSSMHGFYVAKDGVGDIRIQPPDTADEDYLEVSAEQAQEFVGALLDMADAYEEHFADDSPEVVAKLDALTVALAELSGAPVAAAKFNPAEHPRNPAGKSGGGRFRSTVDKLKDAISKGDDDPFAGFDREQLRRAASKRPGITLTRGESHDSIKKKLLADLSKDGDKPAPAKKAAVPRKKAEPKAKPASVAEPKAAPKAPARKRAEPKPKANTAPVPATARVSDKDFGTSRGGEKSSKRLSGASNGSHVELIEFGDGSKAVYKASKSDRETAKIEFDAEQLGVHVAEALGLAPPKMHRTGDDTAFFDYVDSGQVAASIPSLARGEGMATGDYFDTDDGRRIGLLDVLLENPDRHQGNWIVQDDGSITPIDHGLSWEAFMDAEGNYPADRATGLGGFSDHFIEASGFSGKWRDNDLSPAYVKQLGGRLEALAPVFEELGHSALHERMMTRLGIVGSHAKGSVTL